VRCNRQKKIKKIKEPKVGVGACKGPSAKQQAPPARVVCGAWVSAHARARSASKAAAIGVQRGRSLWQ